jgi:ATP-dependent DNA ligase
MPPTGPGWAHELKHDGYRLQIHVRDGRVRLYTMNRNDWTKRYPRIVKEAARLREPVISMLKLFVYRQEGCGFGRSAQPHKR